MGGRGAEEGTNAVYDDYAVLFRLWPAFFAKR
jgi:hypothetical protein